MFATHTTAFVPGGIALAVRNNPLNRAQCARRAALPTTATRRVSMNAAFGSNTELGGLLSLPLPPSVIMAEYVWLDGFFKLRSKSRTVNPGFSSPSDLPEWNYDGSSTCQAPGDDSEVILKPRAIYKDPFRGGDHILVMCDTYTPDGTPIETNTRADCDTIMSKAKDSVPWFGLEQEYFLFDPKTNKPLGFPAEGQPAPQGPYYCGVGCENAFGREIADAAWRAQLYAGLKVGGINAEVAPGQWEFQVGPCVGIEEGDMLWMARYILERVAEIAGVIVNYEPKPVKGDWNGSGCHTNFSTKAMREDGGYEKAILPAMVPMEKNAQDHIREYGKGNDQRLTGKHETAPIDEFRWGVADRGASVRIGSNVVKDGKGYFEDRRPAGNCDPYVVTKMLVKTVCGVSE
ncbi:Glutamine synthetase, chloroplastic [Gracilariopsis chorda]|uniref:Glutamine synthetase n=2 Tax=Gracilariopsis TaxID=2781 RepID=A0A2V3IRW0_9FLOR|nr:glutamine synthetase [Gracilariopsis lemaneiformis]PXF44843.1 Glutamine synthetase, chloroplastic [Gracilariopsis chorda]|eukprot:PXF44843.1 Glutamine synthetase, chloroplastic [Gracilariopsis chorda]